jgi:hypothetical protein
VGLRCTKLGCSMLYVTRIPYFEQGFISMLMCEYSSSRRAFCCKGHLLLQHFSSIFPNHFLIFDTCNIYILAYVGVCLIVLFVRFRVLD